MPMILPFTESHRDMWMKHFFFYTGQVAYYVYLTYLIDLYDPSTSDKETAPKLTMNPVALLSFSSVKSWFSYLTDQGLQHFLTLPFLFLIISIIRTRYPYISDGKLKKALIFCLAAGAVLVMIHVGEFVVESQKWLPMFEGDPIEISEFCWFLLSLLFFGLSLMSLPKRADNKQNP